jgi:hypothetical protein
LDRPDADRAAARSPAPDHESRDTSAHDSKSASDKQEQLWAACVAERPEIILEIAAFIQDARSRIVDPMVKSPPLSPPAGAKSDDD